MEVGTARITTGPAGQRNPGPAAQLNPGPAGLLNPGPAAQRNPGPAGQRNPGPAAQLNPGPAGLLNPGPAALLNPGPAGLLNPGPAAQRNPGPAGQRNPGPAALLNPGPAGLLNPGSAGRQGPAASKVERHIAGQRVDDEHPTPESDGRLKSDGETTAKTARPNPAKAEGRPVPDARQSNYAEEAAELLAGLSASRKRRKTGTGLPAGDPAMEEPPIMVTRLPRKGHTKPAKD
jgi:hypothetical protein